MQNTKYRAIRAGQTPRDRPSYEEAMAVVAANPGWILAGRVGTTAERPTSAVTESMPASTGTVYIDTTLAKVIVFDGQVWLDPVTGAVS